MTGPTLHDDALQGLPGRVVRSIGPHSEADPAALLVTFLAAAGAMIGKEPHLFAGDTEHAARIWPLIIGKTAGGMKGTSANPVLRIVKEADPNFGVNIESGLSSGEGLIERVRDQLGDLPDDKNFVEGIEDKRLLIIESEFAVVLSRSKREGNVLSETLRDSWDGKTLSTMSRKASKLIATSPHIVVVGHVTPTELRAKLSESDVAGGLMNRFLPVHSHRSKRLADGGSTPTVLITELADALRVAIQRTQQARRVTRNIESARLWTATYESLTPDDLPDGAYASVIARAAPQVGRLSLIYALLDQHDGQVQVRTEHLTAALAVWEYVKASADAVFGDLSTVASLNKLTAAITASKQGGMSRTEISALFGRNKTTVEITELITQMLATGRFYDDRRVDGQGRPATRYYERNENNEVSTRQAGVNSSNSFLSLVKTNDALPCGHSRDFLNHDNGKCGQCILDDLSGRAS